MSEGKRSRRPEGRARDPDSRPDLRRVASSFCRFELFGTARLAGGVRWIDVDMDEPITLQSLLPALLERCPALAGSVIDVDQSVLTAGYVLNRNGRDFLKDADAVIRPGDELLVLSSSAGG